MAIRFANTEPVPGDSKTVLIGKLYQQVNDFFKFSTLVRMVLERLRNILLIDAAGSGGGTWGSITGTLADQIDLQAALASKVDIDATPVLAYRALLSQSAADAPEAVVLENTLSGDPVWAYVSPGVYTGTLVGGFPLGQTIVRIGPSLNAGPNTWDSIEATRTDDDTVRVVTTRIFLPTCAQTDGILNLASGVAIEISVYPIVVS